MKKILLGLVFLLIGNNIFAQTIGTINGVVKDKNTQEVLIGVVLKFVGKDTVNTLSDESGNFSVQLHNNKTTQLPVCSCNGVICLSINC